ncbi:hypothetical protein G3I61_28335 [Streptomyces diastaticus]|nr:hypothetical protein [Streptomyces diastaticus]
MTELNPELKARVLLFVRERERVSAVDVRAEFFPGDISRPYLYLDSLTASGDLLVVPSWDHPMTWVPVFNVTEMTTKAESRSAELRAARKAEREAGRPEWGKEPRRVRAAYGVEPRPRVRWYRFSDGKPYHITGEVTQRLYGITSTNFRSRLLGHCKRRGWECQATDVVDDGLIFRIEKPRG